jgi:hypothetical protein
LKRTSQPVGTECLQLLGECGAERLVDAAAVAGGAHQVGQHVGRAQHDLDDLVADRQPARTHLVQRRLEDVGEADQGFQAERAGAALDRVDGPEHRIDGLGIGVAGFHGEQAALQFGELFLALLEEGLADRL